MNKLSAMPPFQRLTRPLQCALLLLYLAFSLAPRAQAQDQSAAANRPQLVDEILVVVNDDVITRQQFEDRLKSVVQRLQQQGGAMPPMDELKHQLLERMIVEKAELQMAKEQGIHVDDNMLDGAISRIADQNKMTVPEFRKALESRGMDYAKFREEIRDEIMMQRLREREVDNKIQVSDAEIDNYLAAHKGNEVPQELDIAQILIRVPDNATSDQVAERKQRAENVLAQLQAGGDFAKLAAAYSDASDGLTGGDLGWRTADRLPQLFVNATANLQPGQVAPIVQSANGFHILKLLGRRSQSVMRGGPSADEAAEQAPVVQTRVSHILIKVNQVVSDADAIRKLRDIKERIENHAATFAEMARLYSNDLSASKGGDLGWVYPGDTVPAFERAMNALQVGQISDPVKTPFGYHLIMVTARKTDNVSQERQRQLARQAIHDQKLEEATQDWLRQVRDQAYVEYRTDNF